MLALTAQKPRIGSKVGYLDGYKPKADGFDKGNVGVVTRVIPDENRYEVEFAHCRDTFEMGQLVLLPD